MIQVKSQPSQYPTMHDALYYVFDSDKSGEASFKYVIDVLVNGNIVSRTKVFPRPIDGTGVINVAPMVRAFVKNYFKPNNEFLSFTTNGIYQDYTIQIGEEYIVGQNLNTYLNEVSIDAKAWNYYLPLFADSLLVNGGGQLAVSNYYETLLIENFTDDILSERDLRNVTMELNDSLFISFLKITDGEYNAHVETYDAYGNLVHGHFGVVNLNTLNVFNLSPSLINVWAGSEIITEDTFIFKFWISKNGAQSRYVQVKLVCNPKYKQMNIHFLNRVGGFDTMRFGLQNRRTLKVTRTSYQKNIWDYNSASTKMQKVDNWNRVNESIVNFSINHDNTYHLVSDWINEQDYEWLADLIASPIVYLEVNGSYFPVSITSDSHEFKYNNADGLFNFEMDIKINNQINSQLR